MTLLHEASRDPFFVYYDARSGSTFLASQLVRRYAVAIPPESDFVVALIDGFPRAAIASESELDRALACIVSERKFADLALDPQALRARMIDRLPCSTADLVRCILSAHRDANFQGAERCGIKKGSYVFHHDALRRLFPEAAFLGIVRDGRAVFNSKKKSLYSVTRRPFETDPASAAHTWVEHVRLLRRIEVESERVMVVRYERLVSELESVLAEVASFLGLSAASSAGHYEVSVRYGSELHAHVDGPPRAERSDAWRHELGVDDVRVYESIAGPDLLREGYRLVSQGSV